MSLVHIRGKVGDNNFVSSRLGGGRGGDDSRGRLRGGDTSTSDWRRDRVGTDDLRTRIAAGRSTTATPSGAVGGDDL